MIKAQVTNDRIVYSYCEICYGAEGDPDTEQDGAAAEDASVDGAVGGDDLGDVVVDDVQDVEAPDKDEQHVVVVMEEEVATCHTEEQ